MAGHFDVVNVIGGRSRISYCHRQVDLKLQGSLLAPLFVRPKSKLTSRVSPNLMQSQKPLLRYVPAGSFAEDLHLASELLQIHEIRRPE